MIDGLVAGRLYGEAERRTDKAGKAYSLAKVRASTAEGEVLFVNVIAFDDDLCASLHRLYDGDSVALSGSLNDEQQRHVREQMSEEELVIFDILTRPAPELSAKERAEVKKVARELLARLKELLVLNWRQKSTARSQVKLGIEDALDTGLPRAYTPELYQLKCAAVFEHVYESYPERNAGVYA